MFATTRTRAHAETVALRRLPIAGSIAVIGAVTANALVYLVASALGAMPQDVVVRAGQPITLGAAAGTTLMSVACAVAVFALLSRFTSRPITIFRVVALLVLALSFLPPFTLAGAPLAMIAALEIMHVAAAAISIYTLTVLTRPREPLRVAA
jgi:hypothetical protein